MLGFCLGFDPGKVLTIHDIQSWSWSAVLIRTVVNTVCLTAMGGKFGAMDERVIVPM